MTTSDDSGRRPATAARTVEDRVARMAGEVEPAVDQVVALSVRIPASLRKRLRIASLEQDKETQRIVAEAIEAWLDRHERRRDR